MTLPRCFSKLPTRSSKSSSHYHLSHPRQLTRFSENKRDYVALVVKDATHRIQSSDDIINQVKKNAVDDHIQIRSYKRSNRFQKISTRTPSTHHAASATLRRFRVLPSVSVIIFSSPHISTASAHAGTVELRDRKTISTESILEGGLRPRYGGDGGGDIALLPDDAALRDLAFKRRPH